MELPPEIIHHLLFNYLPSPQIRCQWEYHRNTMNDIHFIANEPPIKWFWKYPTLFTPNKRITQRYSNVYDYLLRNKGLVF